jgi:AraC-like DNA-binding protein
VLAVEFVESYFDAWNHQDAKCIAEHLAVNGTYCDIPEHKQLSGDDLIADLVEFFAHDHNHYELLGEISTGDNAIAFQYRVCTNGSNARGDCLSGAEFVTLRDGDVIQIADYYQNQPDFGPRAHGHVFQKYAKSGLNHESLEYYKRQLSELMLHEQTYRHPDMTLPELSNLVHCPVNHLSQVINAGFGVSFFDYLNQYRIEDAKKLLGVKDSTHTILTVAFEVGFNSNSAFYAAFKKSCGQTPAQFRRSERS